MAAAIRRIRDLQIDRFDRIEPIVVDVDGVNAHYMRGRCPCITRTRGGAGFYLASHGRRMNVKELLRLQGLPTAINLLRGADISDRQLGQMIGNAMSGNVLSRILKRLLPACGFRISDGG
jgi:site-specific DNA-cytosine methylase